jgi:hypothetical protein
MANRRDALVLVAVVAPYLFVISNYRVWWGEWNPPARYLTDIVPLAVVPLAWWLGRLRRFARWSALLVFVVPAAAVMLTFVLDPQRMYNQPDGTSRLLETWSAWTGINLTGTVPSYVFYSADRPAERLVFALLATAWLGTLATVAASIVSPRSALTDAP